MSAREEEGEEEEAVEYRSGWLRYHTEILVSLDGYRDQPFGDAIGALGWECIRENSSPSKIRFRARAPVSSRYTRENLAG